GSASSHRVHRRSSTLPPALLLFPRPLVLGVLALPRTEEAPLRIALPRRGLHDTIDQCAPDPDLRTLQVREPNPARRLVLLQRFGDGDGRVPSDVEESALA